MASALASAIPTWQIKTPGALRPRGFFLSVAVLRNQTFALRLLAREFARPADGFSLFTGLLDRGFLEMLLQLHFPKHTLALKLLFQRPKSLFNVVIANRYLHVVFTTFLS